MPRLVHVNKPSPEAAAMAIVRTWLNKSGFYEDDEGDDDPSPERIVIDDASGERKSGYFVNVRVYVPYLDIEQVINGTHPDGITVETK